jgi:hypothetical protein
LLTDAIELEKDSFDEIPKLRKRAIEIAQERAAMRRVSSLVTSAMTPLALDGIPS